MSTEALASTVAKKEATPPNTDSGKKHKAAPQSNYSLMAAVTGALAQGDETPAEKVAREKAEKSAGKKGDNQWHDESAEEKAAREEREAAETPEQKATREAEEAAAADGGEDETAEEKAAREEREAAETPEQKATRETEEAAAGGGEDDETAEEKAAREEREAAEGAKPYAADLKKLEAETKEFLRVMLKKLSPADRALVERTIGSRIGKIVVTERAERERLEARVTEMTTELEAAEQAKGPAVVAGVHPFQLAETEDQLNAEEDKLQGFLDWLDDHKDGYDGDAAKNEQSFSAEQIRARRREIERDLNRHLPQARAGLQKRVDAEKDLRKVYPDLFDVKSAAYAERRRILKEQPELKRFPDYLSKVAQLVLGAKAFADLKKGKDAPKKPVTKKLAPRAPGAGGPAKGGGGERKHVSTVAPEAMKSFAKNPSGNALTSLVAGVLGKG